MDSQQDFIQGASFLVAYKNASNTEKPKMLETFTARYDDAVNKLRQQATLVKVRQPDATQEAAVTALEEKKKSLLDERAAILAKINSHSTQVSEQEESVALHRVKAIRQEMIALAQQQQDVLERGDAISASLRERLDGLTAEAAAAREKVARLEVNAAVKEEEARSLKQELEALRAAHQKEREAHCEAQRQVQHQLEVANERLRPLEAAKMAEELQLKRELADAAPKTPYLTAVKQSLFVLSTAPEQKGSVRVCVALPDKDPAAPMKNPEVISLLKNVAENFRSDPIHSIRVLATALQQGGVTKARLELAWTSLALGDRVKLGVSRTDVHAWQQIQASWANLIPVLYHSTLTDIRFSGTEHLEAFLLRHQSILQLLVEVGLVTDAEVVDHLVYAAIPEDYKAANAHAMETFRDPTVTALPRLIDCVSAWTKTRTMVQEKLMQQTNEIGLAGGGGEE